MPKPKLTRAEKIARTIRKRQRAGLPWGRPRIYLKKRPATNAERQRAWRASKKQGRMAARNRAVRTTS
jgi:hypothetical protein